MQSVFALNNFDHTQHRTTTAGVSAAGERIYDGWVAALNACKKSRTLERVAPLSPLAGESGHHHQWVWKILAGKRFDLKPLFPGTHII